MIVKKIANPDKSAGVGTRLSGLLTYVQAPQTTNAAEKCIFYGTIGLTSIDPGKHAEEMADVAVSAPRTRDPVIHYVLSWPADERPTSAQVGAAVDIFLDELDTLPKPPKLRADHTWRDHQWAYALHDDTDNMHVHLVGNRVDPRSNRAIKINRGFDVDAGIRAGARIEHAQGWRPELNKRYAIDEQGAVVPTARAAPDAPKRPSQRDLRREQQTGEPSATRIAIDEALPLIAAARSWNELHQSLKLRDIEYVRSGAGAAIIVAGVPVKASAVGHAATVKRLEERLGAFEPPTWRAEPARKNDVAQCIEYASSWADLHERLGAIGCTYELTRRRGVVHTYGARWNASRLARTTSLTRLEERLGPYTPKPPDVRTTSRGESPTPGDDDVARAIDDATDWRELHTALAALRCVYDTRGSGALVRTQNTEWDASELPRNTHLRELERRFGPYTHAPAGAKVETSRCGPRHPTRDAIATAIDEADTWDELHRALRSLGATYTRKGSGAAVWLGDHEMKASDVSRRATLTRLEARLGTYEPDTEPDPDTPEYTRVRAAATVARASAAEACAGDDPTPGETLNEDLAAIAKEEQRETDEVEEILRRRAPTSAPARDTATGEDPGPRPGDAARVAAAAAAQAREHTIIRTALLAELKRKWRKLRRQAHARYRSALAAVRTAGDRPPTRLEWQLANGNLRPEHGWDAREAEGCIRPAALPTAGSAAGLPVKDHTALRVGARVEYRDHQNNVACADIGTEIIVRHPGEPERQAAGLNLALAKWGDVGLVVDLPPPRGPGDPPARDTVGGWRREIHSIHEEIARLREIASRNDAKVAGFVAEQGLDREKPRRNRDTGFGR